MLPERLRGAGPPRPQCPPARAPRTAPYTRGRTMAQGATQMGSIRYWAVAVLLSGAAGAADTVLAQPANGMDGSLSVADYIQAEQAGGLGPNKRAAISSFVVQFVRDQGIERDAGSFGMFQGKSATYFTQVRGADDALLQAVADKLYDNFAAALKAAGVELVPQAELEATPEFQEIRKVSPKPPLVEALETGARKDKHMAVNVLVTAKGLPLVTYGVVDKKWLPAQASGIGALQAVALGSATAAKSLQAPLLNLRLTVAMVEQKGKGWGSSAQFGNLVHKTANWQFESDPLPRYVDGGTLLMVHGVNLSGLPSSKNVLTLVKPVAITGLQLTAEKGEGVSARGSGLLGAIGRAAGGTDQAADAYLDIVPANFSSRLTEGGTKVLELFATALAQP